MSLRDRSTLTESPGAAPSLEDVLAGYVRAVGSGAAVDREALVRLHPEWADELRAFFVNRDRMEALARPFRTETAAFRPPPSLGTKLRYFGDYELLEQIGSGGMGVIYKARQISLDRVVALKMILDTTQDSARFMAEAEAAASLDHPHIVAIYEIGEHEGRPYYSMQFVDGVNLGERVRERPLAPREAAQLAATTAHSVHYAHQRGVLHRDLKPANVVVDSAGQPHITDFGLAKHAGRQDELTHSGQVLGTPSYMAPEQAAGRTKEWTTSTDVYGLGTILYASLTGRAPFSGSSSWETLRQVREREPERPTAINRLIPPDLETICLKCLQKEPARRYGSAEDLAQDLERYLRDEPILARAVGPVERVWRWCRRNPVVAGLEAAIAVLLVVTAVGGGWMASRERIARKMAEQAGEQESAAASTARVAQVDAEAARRKAQASLAEALSTNGLTAMEEKDWADALLWFAGAAGASREDTRAQQVHLARARAVRRYLPNIEHVFDESAAPYWWLEFHPSGRYLAGRTMTGEVRLWDLATGERLPEIRALADITGIVWSPDGEHLALGNRHGDVGVFRLSDGSLVRLLPHREPVQELAFSSDGHFLAAAGRRATVWEWRAGRQVATTQRHPRTIYSLSIAGQNKRLVTACRDQKLRIFSLATSEDPVKPLWPPRPHAVPGLVGRPMAIETLDAGRLVLAARNNRSLACVDVETGNNVWEQQFQLIINAVSADPTGQWFIMGCNRRARIRRSIGDLEGLIVHRHHIAAADFSPDGHRVATAGWDRMVRVSSVPDGELIVRLMHQRPVVNVVFSPDGGRLVTVQIDGLMRVWTLPDEPQLVRRWPAARGGSLVRLSPDGRLTAAAGTTWTGGRLKTTQVYDVATGQPAGEPCTPGGTILDATFSPDATRLVTASAPQRFQASATAAGNAGELHFWNWKTGELDGDSLTIVSEPRSIAFRPDGGQLAVLRADGRVDLVDPKTRRTVAAWDTEQPIRWWHHYVNNGQLRYSPDGRSLAVWGNKDVLVWDVESGKLRYPPLSHDGLCHDIHWSPDGKLLATASFDRRARVWDFETGQLARPPLVHPELVLRARFSPDGAHLLTACRDNQARLLDWRSGQLVGAACEHDEEIFDARFTPDGNWLVTTSLDRKVRVWERRTGKLVLPAFALDGAGWQLEISPDGRHVVVGGSSRNVNLIDLSELATATTTDEQTTLLLGELASGRTLRHDAVINLTSDEWLERWQRHRGAILRPSAGDDASTRLVPPQPSLYVFARNQVRSCLETGLNLVLSANAVAYGYRRDIERQLFDDRSRR
jgi:WD40 repeat protein/tRNA A-37 threonylcarbamoyl transferase component Bud32